MMERIWKKVRVTPGCWWWEGVRSTRGYGRVRVGRKWKQVHRIVWEHFFAPIPDGLQIDHICMNKVCQNPGHMRLVTGAENLRRWKESWSACWCRNGHRRTDENTRRDKKGDWLCLDCCREHRREYRKTHPRTRRRKDPSGLCRNGNHPSLGGPCKECARERYMRTYKARPKVSATHCKYGHEFTPENTRVRTSGGRACRICERAEKKRYRAGHREAVRRWKHNWKVAHPEEYRAEKRRHEKKRLAHRRLEGAKV